MPRGIAALLVSAAALVAPDQARRDTTAPTTGTGSISGRVLAASTGDPLRKAIVIASSSAGNFPPAIADAEGRFVVASLPAGRYTLTASKAGYVHTEASNPAPIPPGIDVADGARLEGD